ncbi:ComEC/Rec2 family competence protein [bacterium SCSIO 12741]|nr:ComEC/Rec2 family competence protein [bacterium SCSIO 12741]
MSTINRHLRTKPFVRILAFMIPGVVLGYVFEHGVDSTWLDPGYLLYASYLILGLIAIPLILERFVAWTFRFRWWFGTLVASWFFVLGFALFLQNRIPHWENKAIAFDDFKGRSAVFVIDQFREIDVHRYKYQVHCLSAARVPDGVEGLSGFLFLDRSFCPGDTVMTKGSFQNLRSMTHPSLLDFREVFYEKGFYFDFYGHQSIPLGYGAFTFDNPAFWRHSLAQRLEGLLNEESSALIKAMLLGDKSGLDKELRASYAASGAMHVLAVSGLHVGLIFLVLFQVTSWFFQGKSRALSSLLPVAGIQIYAMLTGFVPSVFRASSMISLYVIGKYLQRRADVINIICGAAFIMLLVNPTQLFQVSFQLSFAALTGIVWVFPKIRKLWSPKNQVTAYIWDLLALSLAAQLATFPLGLYYFHQFPFWFLLSNLVVVPGAFLIITGSLLLLAVSPFESLAVYVAWCMEVLIHTVNALVSWIDSLPPGAIQGVHIQAWDVALLYFLIWALLEIGFQQKFKRVYPALATVLLLFVSSTYSEWSRQNRRGILVYNHTRPMVEVFQGKHSVVITSEKYTSRIAFARQGWVEMQGIENTVILPHDTSWSNGWVTLNDGSAQLLDELWNLHLTSTDDTHGMDRVVTSARNYSIAQGRPGDWLFFGNPKRGKPIDENLGHWLSREGYLLIEK